MVSVRGPGGADYSAAGLQRAGRGPGRQESGLGCARVGGRLRVWPRRGFLPGLGRGKVRPDAGAPGGAPVKRECVFLRALGSAGRAGNRAVHEGCGGPRGGPETARSARGLGVHGRPGGRALRAVLGPLY